MDTASFYFVLQKRKQSLKLQQKFFNQARVGQSAKYNGEERKQGMVLLNHHSSTRCYLWLSWYVGKNIPIHLNYYFFLLISLDFKCIFLNNPGVYKGYNSILNIVLKSQVLFQECCLRICNMPRTYGSSGDKFTSTTSPNITQGKIIQVQLIEADNTKHYRQAFKKKRF